MIAIPSQALDYTKQQGYCAVTRTAHISSGTEKWRTQLLDLSGGETMRGEGGAVATRWVVRLWKNAEDPQEWRMMERTRERQRQAGRRWYLRQISCYGDKQEGEAGMKLSGRWDCTGLLMICKNNCFILPPLEKKKKNKQKKHMVTHTHRHYKYALTRTHTKTK